MDDDLEKQELEKKIKEIEENIDGLNGALDAEYGPWGDSGIRDDICQEISEKENILKEVKTKRQLLDKKK